MKINLVKQEDNLSGSEIVDRLRKGHMVRRACWVDGLLIRITNEGGFDEEGNAIFQPGVPIYTIATNGYFLHIGHSNQPLRRPKVWVEYGDVWRIDSRHNEGLDALFAEDWEDYGFVTRKEFDALEDILRPIVEQNIEDSRHEAVREAMKNQESE